MDTSPLISIVTPAYKCKNTIKETFDSVISQTYKNWEWIIVDDCSPDDTFDFLKANIIDSRITITQTDKNGGTAYARNAGLTHVKGSFLVFLDSDDMIDSNFLEEQLNFINESGSAVVTSGYRRLAENSNTDFIPPKIITYKSILNGNPVSCLSTMINLSITGVKYFDVSLIKNEDYLYWINLIKEFGDIKGNQKTLATYRILPSSKSRNKKALVKWQLAVYKKIGLNFLSRWFHLFRWAIYGIKKYRKVK